MVALRRLDAFTKTRPDLQQTSVVGGVITLVATTTAALLFIGQIVNYMRGDARHSLSLSKSISIPLIPLTQSSFATQIMDAKGRVPLHLHVTFPYLACDRIDLVHDGASLLSGEIEEKLGVHTLVKRKPTSSEIKKFGERSMTPNTGCTVIGGFRPHIVAGTFSISMDARSWAEATTALSMGFRDPLEQKMNSKTKALMQRYNVTHYIHSIRFGQSFPKAADMPLENLAHVIENDFYGIAVAQTQVKLIPTTTRANYNDFFGDGRNQMYQMSVVDIVIQPHTLMSHGSQTLPGLAVSYDFTPLMVHHNDGREPILVFLSSLISIVGGVFVTVTLLTGCLVNTAQAVAKKVD